MMKDQINLFHYFIVFIFAIFLFQGCKDKSSNFEIGTLSGTITLPYPAPNKTLYVMIDNDINGDNGFLYSFQGYCSPDTIENYTINNVATGTYYVYAAVFVKGNGEGGPQKGDFLGLYGGSLDNPPNAPNVIISANDNTNCSFELSIYNGKIKH